MEMLPVTIHRCPCPPSIDPGLQAGAIAVIRKIMVLFPELSERQSDRTAMAREWARELADLEPQEIERGLRTMRNCRFAPNIGEFRHLCRPALNPEYAWEEAQERLKAQQRGKVGVWSPPGRLARRRRHVLGHEAQVEARARAQLEMHLTRELAAGWGEEVAAPAPRISYEPPAQDGPTVSAENRQRLAELAKSFRVATRRG